MHTADVEYSCQFALLQPYEMRYLDSIIVITTALRNFLDDNHTFHAPQNERGVCGIGKTEPWDVGQKLLDYILNVSHLDLGSFDLIFVAFHLDSLQQAADFLCCRSRRTEL